MKDTIEIKGYWWLPDAAENKLPGTLSFSQEEGAILEIVGVFGTERNARIEQPNIILGFTQQGKPITAYKCYYKKWTYPITGLGGGQYRVHFVFDGVHFESEESIKFNRLMGSYTDLDAWVDISGFTIESDKIDNKNVHKINYEKPSTQMFDIGNEFEVGISFSSHGPTQSIVQTKVEISQRSYLVVKCKNGDVDFESMFAKLNICSYLLQIAVQRIPYPISIFGYSQDNAQERNGEEPYYPEIKIYYQPVEALTIQKLKLPQEMLFIYKDLSRTEITNWFHHFETFQTVIHLYRTLFYSNRLFIETKFLNIAQALESLHSNLFNNHILPHDEYVSRKRRVLQDVSGDLREWLKDALRNANYKPFREKIYELLTNKQDIIAAFIDDFKLFAKRVMHTRNEFIHHNKRKWTFQRGEELLSAIDILTILFEAYIFEEVIGFSSDKTKELLDSKIQTHLTGWKTLRSIKK